MIVVTSYNNRHTRGAARLVLHGICRPRSGSLGRVAAKQRSGVSFFDARNITSVLVFYMGGRKFKCEMQAIHVMRIDNNRRIEKKVHKVNLTP